MKIMIDCPICRQKLRIPFTFGVLKITCPRCAAIFYYKPKFTNFFNGIFSAIRNVFTIPSRKFEYTNYGYTNIHSANKIQSLFVLWLVIILGLLLLTLLFKNINESKILNNIDNNKIKTNPINSGETNDEKLNI